MKKIWSAGFGISKIKTVDFMYRKLYFGMQASAPFFGSLQALDSENQRKRWSAGFGTPPPPWYTPNNSAIFLSYRLVIT